MSFLRRLRATAVLAVAWGVLWAPFGIALYLALGMWVEGLRSPSWRDTYNLIRLGAMVGGAWGLLSGAIFSLALAAAERRGSIERLARRRVMLWGALSGVVFPTIAIATIASQQRIPDGDRLFLLGVTVTSVVYGALVAGALLAAARGPAPVGGA